jgi:hypothetical protein
VNLLGLKDIKLKIRTYDRERYRLINVLVVVVKILIAAAVDFVDVLKYFCHCKKSQQYLSNFQIGLHVIQILVEGIFESLYLTAIYFI